MTHDWVSFFKGAVAATVMIGIGGLVKANDMAHAQGVTSAATESSVYLISVGRIVPDTNVAPYTAAMMAAAEGRGMVPLAFDFDFQVLEGDFAHQGYMSVEKAPSMDALKDFWNSPAYQAAIPLREGVFEVEYAVAVHGY